MLRRFFGQNDDYEQERYLGGVIEVVNSGSTVRATLSTRFGDEVKT
ncbi:MAG: hypothetical protein ACE5H4_13535 [Candidatus Thorarchaeota archaeon]